MMPVYVIRWLVKEGEWHAKRFIFVSIKPMKLSWRQSSLMANVGRVFRLLRYIELHFCEKFVFVLPTYCNIVVFFLHLKLFPSRLIYFHAFCFLLFSSRVPYYFTASLRWTCRLQFPAEASLQLINWKINSYCLYHFISALKKRRNWNDI